MGEPTLSTYCIHPFYPSILSNIPTDILSTYPINPPTSNTPYQHTLSINIPLNPPTPINPPTRRRRLISIGLLPPLNDNGEGTRASHVNLVKKRFPAEINEINQPWGTRKPSKRSQEANIMMSRLLLSKNNNSVSPSASPDRSPSPSRNAIA